MNQKQLERSYRIAILITLVVCMYLTGVINALLFVHVLPTSLQAVVKSFFIRESLVIYPILVIIASVIGAYAIHKNWVESQRSDFLGRNFLYAEDSEAYGNAHFELPYEYINAAQIRSIERCRGKILGMLDTDDDDGGDCVDFAPDGRGNQHIIVFGTSGGGKSFTFVKPYMFQSVKQRHSLVITDPDGGLYRTMAGYFKDNGYVVRKLDLKNLQKSDGWDCMKPLRTGDLESNVKIFAETIISNTTGENNMDKYTLTDAKYTEEPRSPIVSMLHVAAGDIRRVCKIISSLPGISSVCDATGKGWKNFLMKNTWAADMLPHKAKKSETLYAPNPIVETAEMHAFDRFRKEYAQKDELLRSNRFVERSTGDVVDTSIPAPNTELLTKVEDSWADDDDDDVDSRFIPAAPAAQTIREKTQAAPKPSTPEQPALTRKPEPIREQGASVQRESQGRGPQLHAPYSRCNRLQPYQRRDKNLP